MSDVCLAPDAPEPSRISAPHLVKDAIEQWLVEADRRAELSRSVLSALAAFDTAMPSGLIDRGLIRAMDELRLIANRNQGGSDGR